MALKYLYFFIQVLLGMGLKLILVIIKFEQVKCTYIQLWNTKLMVCNVIGHYLVFVHK